MERNEPRRQVSIDAACHELRTAFAGAAATAVARACPPPFIDAAFGSTAGTVFPIALLPSPSSILELEAEVSEVGDEKMGGGRMRDLSGDTTAAGSSCTGRFRLNDGSGDSTSAAAVVATTDVVAVAAATETPEGRAASVCAVVVAAGGE
jgi:hypothetical protein